MSHLSIDTSWCPVCDRAIVPKRIQIPISPPSPTLKSKSGTIRPSKHQIAQGGLVNGTGRGLRRQQKQQVEEPIPVKTRTIISQEPAPYYCSEECRIRDLQNDIESLHLSNTPLHAQFTSEDLDEPLPLRVPHNTPCDSNSPPSPLLVSSSGTESDSSAASYSPTEILRNLPPLRRKPSKKSADTLNNNGEFHGGAMMAARRIQAAFATASDPSLPGCSKKQIVIPGWTDGDRTQWRASVYPGSPSQTNIKYKSIDASGYTGGSFSAQAARRAVGEEEPPRRVAPAGQSAPQFSLRAIHEQFKPAFRRTESSSHLSISPKDITIPSPPEESKHPLLSTPLHGRLLVPQLRGESLAPSRCGSTSDLTSLRREPISTSKGTPSKQAEPTVEPSRSWGYTDQFTYPLPSRRTSKERRLQDVWIPSAESQSGISEGRWEKREVEVEVPVERKRLFLFGH